MTEALKLMLTGMGTVFFILIMVVVLGNVIIRVTNSYTTEPVKKTGAAGGTSAVESHQLAAIVSAVSMVTKGKGRVTSVEKIHD